MKRLEKLVAECPGSYIKAGMVSHGFGVNGEADNYEGKGKVKTPARKVFSRWAAVLTRSHPMPCWVSDLPHGGLPLPRRVVALLPAWLLHGGAAVGDLLPLAVAADVWRGSARAERAQPRQ